MYKDAEYADSRIRGTIVLCEGKPVYVNRVHGDMTCSIVVDIEKGEETRVSIDNLKVLAPALGFTNIRQGAIYISRKPMRCDWRQGLRTSQVVVLGINSRYRPELLDIIRCLNNIHDSLGDAISIIREGNISSWAISKELCLADSGEVIEVLHTWRGRVGEIVNNAIVLDEDKEYLNYLLEKINA